MRKLPADRKAEILAAALRDARDVGYQQITRESVALRARCSPALISAYFGTMKRFRRAVMSAAVAQLDLEVIAQGLAAGDPKAHQIKKDLKIAALERLL